MDHTECILENVEEQLCYAIRLSREDFEKFCNSLINKTEKCILNAIQNCKQNISEIIMVGGASRIFVVKQIFKRLLPDSTFNSTLVPEEAIVFGAAIKAEMLSKSLSTSSLIGDIQNTAKSLIYCKTDFGEIQIIKSFEVLPSTPRCFSHFYAVQKIEFFEKGITLESLGYIENIPENSYVLCEFDNNGILKCFINEKPVVLKQKKELSNVDDQATTAITITSNEMKQNLNPYIGTQKQSEKALINSYGSNQISPIPFHDTNPINSENKVYGSNNSIYTAKATSPNNSLTSNVNSTTKTSDRDQSLANVNTSDARNVAEQPLRYPSSSSSSNHINDRSTTSSSYPTSRPETLKEKEKSKKKFTIFRKKK
uniref:Heat shock protein 70 n=1 Tax=Panagrolaimus davidi TaxID=227884 RepID=A0A914P5Q2_9BILA